MSLSKCSPELGTDVDSSLGLVNFNLLLTPESLDNGLGDQSAQPTLDSSQQGPMWNDKYHQDITEGA